MVVLVPEADLVQQVLELFPAAVHVANKDQALPLVGEVLLVHVLDLDHVLEVGAHVAAVAHERGLVHESLLVQVHRVSRPEVEPPAEEEEECGGEEPQGGALDASREAVDPVLPLDGDQKVVVSAVEAVFFVRHVEQVVAVGDEVDERRVASRHVRIVAVVRHGSGTVGARPCAPAGEVKRRLCLCRARLRACRHGSARGTASALSLRREPPGPTNRDGPCYAMPSSRLRHAHDSRALACIGEAGAIPGPASPRWGQWIVTREDNYKQSPWPSLCIDAAAMHKSKPRQVEQMGQIAVFGESQVGKTCFIEKVHFFSICPCCIP
jgi:hypothetical protein